MPHSECGGLLSTFSTSPLRFLLDCAPNGSHIEVYTKENFHYTELDLFVTFSTSLLRFLLDCASQEFHVEAYTKEHFSHTVLD